MRNRVRLGSSRRRWLLRNLLRRWNGRSGCYRENDDSWFRRRGVENGNRITGQITQTKYRSAFQRAETCRLTVARQSGGHSLFKIDKSDSFRFPAADKNVTSVICRCDTGKAIKAIAKGSHRQSRRLLVDVR